ncbi:L-seryl-tRNA(Sec) selenium transferase [Helicobacter sp. 23-1046]
MHTQQNQMRLLPKVDCLLHLEIFHACNKDTLKPIIHKHLDALRVGIKSNNIDCLEEVLQSLPNAIKREYDSILAPSLVPVVNATGVVLQTNLGRSVFDTAIIERVIPLLARYSTLEYDLAKGERASRYMHANALLKALFGEEYEFLLVNNNAAAVLLVLQTFAQGKEVIISRGELVEIGGAFRIPEVMKCAGCILREVGATNKTHLQDYQNAINEQSAIIMKAHQSNFAQVGFCAQVSMQEITTLAQENGLIDYYDVGSGFAGVEFDDTDSKFVKNLHTKEPSLKEIFALKPSLVSFSGDKLFGSAQVGIIAGRKDLIENLKSNHLLRALRVDKLCISTLQATLELYIKRELDKIPTLAMLHCSLDSLQNRANTFITMLNQADLSSFSFELLELDSVAGGGSLPDNTFKSYGIGIKTKAMSAAHLESILRKEFFIITRVFKQLVAIDMRTLLQGDENQIVQSLKSIQKQLDKSATPKHTKIVK